MTSKPDERSAQKPGGGDPAANLPFSRVILVEQVPEAGTDVVIQASAAECAALAALDGLAGIGMLEAHFHIAHRPNKGFNVSGHVRASISPICVVSLEAFEATVEEDIDVDFAPQADLPKPRETKSKPETVKSRGLAPLEEQEVDPPDPIVDGKIDLVVCVI
jgi:hypothetical protein